MMTLLTGRRRWQARHGRSDQLQWRHVENQLQWWHVELQWTSFAIPELFDETLLTGRRRWRARHGRSDQLQWWHVDGQLQWWHVELQGYSTAILVLVVFAVEIVTIMDVGSDRGRKTQHDNGSPFFWRVHVLCSL